MEKITCPECRQELSVEMIDVNMCFLCGCIIDKSLFENTSNNNEENNDEMENSTCNSVKEESNLESCDDKTNNVAGLNLTNNEIEAEKKLECLRCNSKMYYLMTEKIQLGQTGYLLGNRSNIIAGSIQLEIYTCPSCGKVEFFQPSGQVEQEDRIAQRRCPKCGYLHDVDYPKCPFCKFDYFED